MLKGERTKKAILAEAVDLASVGGLRGLSIGSLAAHTGMSKSGLFAHFGSKEALRVETLRAGVDLFNETVVRPALAEPRGLARVRALFDRWRAWTAEQGPVGGCLLVAASIELDDEGAGPARDFLVGAQRGWLEVISRTARFAVAVGDFRRDLDCEQFAHEFNAIALGFHQSHRLLRDITAADRSHRSFQRLVEDATVR